MSVSTVSSVLNGKANFSEKTVKKIWDAANRLQYSPSISARDLRFSSHKKRRETGVLLHILHTGSTPVPGGEAEKSLFLMTMESQKRNYCSMHYLYQEKNGFRCPQLMNGLVDGVLIGTSHCDVIHAVAEKVPTVLMDLPFVKEEVRGVPMVNPDWQYGAGLAFDLLYEKGHRKIAFLEGYDKAAASNYRNQIQFLRNSAGSRGLTVREDYSFRRDFTPEKNETLLREYLSLLIAGVERREITAVYAPDAIFLTLLRPMLEEAGVRVGRDLALVGQQLSADAPGEVSTVYVPRQKLFSSSLDLLKGMISGGEALPVTELLIRPELINTALIPEITL